MKSAMSVTMCALMDSQYLAGVTAGWNAANSDDPNEKLREIHEAYDGRLKPLLERKKSAAPKPEEQS